MKNENPFRHFVRFNEKFTTNKSNSFVETNELPIVNFNVGSDFLISAFMGMSQTIAFQNIWLFFVANNRKRININQKKKTKWNL